MKTVSRAYDSYSQARAAVDAVEKAGIPSKDVSIVANKYVSAEYADVDDVNKAAAGAGIGGAVGAGAGLLAGLGLLAIPGLGPVVAAGWLASTAAVAAGGAAAGGIVGALVDAGTDKEHAEVYSESVRRGATLVTARVNDADASRVEAILANYRPIDPVARGADYRKEGWTTFDPKAPAYRPNQTEIDRMRANWPG
ncbi:hypothetical protein LJ725_25320 [Reyranella aquatilis]|uniref:General stress protein 17M-like domain-containing protein n=1 Tax=Reyranella aquatilis TaxID=2035356 RepID=A0ABS8L1T3_9HYPH|nr:hypothetical protein [Reyranella aquatilis]MCC8432309.1 hypothetical protein [Reyranella aquatilis]